MIETWELIAYDPDDNVIGRAEGEVDATDVFNVNVLSDTTIKFEHDCVLVRATFGPVGFAYWEQTVMRSVLSRSEFEWPEGPIKLDNRT